MNEVETKNNIFDTSSSILHRMFITIAQNANLYSCNFSIREVHVERSASCQSCVFSCQFCILRNQHNVWHEIKTGMYPSTYGAHKTGSREFEHF